MLRQVCTSVAVVLVCAATGARAGTLTGTIHYTGEPPTRRPVPNVPTLCGAGPIYDESLVTGAGLANVVVYVDDAPVSSVAPAGVTVRQEGCAYVPHVQAAVVGSDLSIVNGDNVFHTAHGYAQDGSSVFNVATPGAGFSATRKLDTPGPVHLKCDAGHTWMDATVFVLPHRFFAVTGPDGKFTIEGLEPGSYTVKTWHERLGERTTKVALARGHDGKVELTYP